MQFKLHHYWRSSASWRVRYALALKEISYTSLHVDLLKAEEKAPAFLALNPNGYVPCLQVEGQNLSESVAILEWLEERFPSPKPLLPGDEFARAEVRRFVELINSGIQPLVNLDVVRAISEDKAEQTAWSKRWIERGLLVCERLLEARGQKAGEFCFGKAESLADVFLIPQCYSALRNEVDLTRFLRVHRIYELAKTTEAFQASCPERHQP